MYFVCRMKNCFFFQCNDIRKEFWVVFDCCIKILDKSSFKTYFFKDSNKKRQFHRKKRDSSSRCWLRKVISNTNNKNLLSHEIRNFKEHYMKLHCFQFNLKDKKNVPEEKTFHFVKISLLLHLPLSLSTLSLQFVSNGIEQSDPAQPSMQTHLYSPSSKVHCPLREQPFSHPAAASDVRKEEKKYNLWIFSHFFREFMTHASKKGRNMIFSRYKLCMKANKSYSTLLLISYFRYCLSMYTVDMLICATQKKVYIYVIFCEKW